MAHRCELAGPAPAGPRLVTPNPNHQPTMLKELIGRTVTVHLGTASGFTDALKGEVLEVSDTWLKLQTRKTIQLIQIEKIGRISVQP